MKNVLRSFSILAGLVLVPAVAATLAGQAAAADMLDVEIDQSRMMTLTGTPGAVIVGNPSIADVSLHADKIFVHGRAFGQTNLIVLDLNGAPVAQFDIAVKNTAQTAMSVYKGTLVGVRRKSYNCWPYCESAMQTGDDPEYNGVIITGNSMKSALATGKESSEAKAPAAPQ
jgi:hypothetical protein